METHMTEADLGEYVALNPDAVKRWGEHLRSCSPCRREHFRRHPRHCCLLALVDRHGFDDGHEGVVERWGAHVQDCAYCRQGMERIREVDNRSTILSVLEHFGLAPAPSAMA